jgi:hypothetical protein
LVSCLSHAEILEQPTRPNFSFRLQTRFRLARSSTLNLGKTPMEPMKPMQPMKPMDFGPKWWPEDLGEPSSSGAQNDVSYAFFADSRRLAIKQDGDVTLYDSGDHKIGGVSQQQGSRNSLAFSSQNGDVKLGDLRRVGA